MESLVSTQWLADHLAEPGLVIVDSSWHMPATGRNGRNDFLQAHIPGARFLDIEEISDPSNPAPHMLPSAEQFSRAMEQAGIGSDERIVVYDNSPLRTAARGWFMLRHFGARDVAILDGGLQKWTAEGRPTQSGEAEPRTASFQPQERSGDVVTKQDILRGTGLPLVDARGKPRFEGSEPEPRPGMASGHIPGARNIPYSALYNEDGTFKGREEIARILRRRRLRSEATVRCQLRFGGNGDQPHPCRAFARQRRNPPLRWKLERMGRRPGDSQGDRPGGLAAEDPLEVAQAAFQLFGDDPHRRDAGVEALLALERDRVETRRRHADELGRAAVEAAPGCLVRALPPLR